MNLRGNLKKPKFFLKGIATYLPAGISRFLPQHQRQFGGRGLRSYAGKAHVARGYYSVWMRTLSMLHEHGALGRIDTVGEIGPGDSIATGIAMLLSGANRYVGLDIVPTAHNFNNEEILDEMIELFKRREPIPDNAEYPKSRPYLSSYAFPADILTDEKLAVLLSDERIGHIRQAVRDMQEGKEADPQNPIRIEYLVPWTDEEVIRGYEQTIDLIISSAAMEHVDDVPLAYASAARLLAPGGIIVSTIDYKGHDTSGSWNGHWAYGDSSWKIVRGKSSYLINRWSHSMHLEELRKLFIIVKDVRFLRGNPLAPEDVAPRFRALPAVDFETGEGFIIARKK